MRVSDGARRTSKNGGNIHVHDDVAPAFNYQPPLRSTPQIKLAPIEVRDAIYRELIRISPAGLYQQQLKDHPQVGLVSRGLLRKETLSYGALPATQKERAKLARSLRSFAKAHFPKYANLIGIPGVWQDPKGFTHIWKPRNYRMPMLLIQWAGHEKTKSQFWLNISPAGLFELHFELEWKRGAPPHSRA
jgi:hypothetical protein